MSEQVGHWGEHRPVHCPALMQTRGKKAQVPRSKLLLTGACLGLLYEEDQVQETRESIKRCRYVPPVQGAAHVNGEQLVPFWVGEVEPRQDKAGKDKPISED